MYRARIASFALILAALVVIPGCTSQNKVTAPAAPAPASTDLAAREAAHYQFALGSSTAVALLAETSNYSVDMRGMMDTMMTACKNMKSMGSGMMGGHSIEDMQKMMDRMRQVVGMHESRMPGMGDLAAMRAERKDHHKQMGTMFTEMDGMMGSGGGHQSHH